MRLGLAITMVLAIGLATPAAQENTGLHVVRPGETLRQITTYYLGGDARWQENWKLNPEVSDPNKLLPGQRIRVLLDRQQPRQTASIDKVARRVQSKPDPVDWLAAQAGDVLRVRDAIRTFTGSSAELLFDDGVRLQVTEDSLIFLRTMGQTARGEKQKSIEIGAGQADLASGSSAKVSDIELVIGTAVARPRPSADGAQARLRRSADGSSQIMVYVGDSTVSSGGSTITVPRGMGTAVPAQGPPSPPQPLLPAPRLSEPAVAAMSEFANPSFAWQPVAGAARYTVEVCRDETCGALVVRARVAASPWTPPRLPVGGLFWRVTAVAGNGLDGYPSGTRSLTVNSDRVAATIGGGVFEDVAGSGGLTGAVPRPGVTVHLYDGIASVTDRTAEPRATTRTDAGGRFSFAAAGPAAYWIAVDTTSITPSTALNDGARRDLVLADQSFGPAGALCSTPSAVAPAPLTAAGACFGGRTDLPRDNPRTLGGSRSVVRVAVDPTRPADLLFAYSFQTVSTPADVERGTPRQGSLRQFLINAAALQGPNTMRFVPAIPPNAGSWWKVTLTEDLPPIGDPGTVVDGQPFDTRWRPTAPSPRAVPVGVSARLLERPATPGLEIDGAGFAGLAIAASDTVVRHVAIHSAMTMPRLVTGDRATRAQIVLHGGASAAIEHVVVGARPDLSRLARAGIQSDCGIGVFDRATATISKSLVRDQRMYGILVQSDSSAARIIATDVEVAGSGFGSRLGDGIGLHSDGSELRRVYAHENGNDGVLAYDGGAGIEIWADRSQYGSSANRNLIEESTIAGNGRGLTISTNAMNNVVRQSVVRDNAQTGILLNTYTRALIPGGNRLTSNVVLGNGGSAIALDGSLNTASADPPAADNDGQLSDAQPNGGLDAPVMELASTVAAGITVSGFVGSSTGQAAFAGVTVEVVDADTGAVLGRGTTDAAARFAISLPSAAVPPSRIRALAIDALGNTSPFGPAITVSR